MVRGEMSGIGSRKESCDERVTVWPPLGQRHERKIHAGGVWGGSRRLATENRKAWPNQRAPAPIGPLTPSQGPVPLITTTQSHVAMECARGRGEFTSDTLQELGAAALGDLGFNCDHLQRFVGDGDFEICGP